MTETEREGGRGEGERASVCQQKNCDDGHWHWTISTRRNEDSRNDAQGASVGEGEEFQGVAEFRHACGGVRCCFMGRRMG